ncbi:MAG TPA: HNH endonuclease, partial [Thiotrichaceae bacterium]|nr:HNH endonuclease [Thiotrichaceae bacterium]
MKKLNALLFNQGGKCFYCDAILDMNEATLDHVIPQSKGGKNDLDNLVVCCKYANHAFRDYSPKHKMAVIKELCCLSSVCKKIFPREEEISESEELEEPQIEAQPKKKTQDSKAKTTQKIQPNISIANQLLLKAIASFEKEGKEITVYVGRNYLFKTKLGKGCEVRLNRRGRF